MPSTRVSHVTICQHAYKYHVILCVQLQSMCISMSTVTIFPKNLTKVLLQIPRFVCYMYMYIYNAYKYMLYIGLCIYKACNAHVLGEYKAYKSGIEDLHVKVIQGLCIIREVTKEW